MLGYDMMLPLNSGAEAVEAAVKLARKWGYEVKGVPDDQAEIIVCCGNFHGRTTTSSASPASPNIASTSARSRQASNSSPSATWTRWSML